MGESVTSGTSPGTTGPALGEQDLSDAAAAIARLRAVVEDAEAVLARLEQAPEGFCLRCGAPLASSPGGDDEPGGQLCREHGGRRERIP